MHTTTCLTWPLLEVGRTVTWSPSKPSTRLHTTRFGFTGERAMTTSPGLTFSNLDDKCSNSNISPETLNVGSMLGPKHWHTNTDTRLSERDLLFLQTSNYLFLPSFHMGWVSGSHENTYPNSDMEFQILFTKMYEQISGFFCSPCSRLQSLPVQLG